MKTYKVYELIDQQENIVYVGLSKRPEGRYYDHIVRKPTQSGRGKFHGRHDLNLRIHSEHPNRKEAWLAEGTRKLELGMEWTEQEIRVKNGYDSLTSGKIRKGQISAQARIVCEHCGIESNKLNYGKWHGKNCKLQIANKLSSKP